MACGEHSGIVVSVGAGMGLEASTPDAGTSLEIKRGVLVVCETRHKGT